MAENEDKRKVRQARDLYKETMETMETLPADCVSAIVP